MHHENSFLSASSFFIRLRFGSLTLTIYVSVPCPGLQGGVFLSAETAPALFEYLNESQEDAEDDSDRGRGGGEQQLGRTARHLLKHSGLDVGAGVSVGGGVLHQGK